MTWWSRKRARNAGSGGPTDAETADAMRRLADEFVQSSGEPDLLDFTVGSIAVVERLVDSLLEVSPAAEVHDSFGLSLTAYVGEVIVRSGAAARWAYDLDQRAPVVEGRELVGNPGTKVFKRITVGPEHSLEQFVRVAVEDALPPEARRIRTFGVR